jgi:hypothetical protein
MTTKRCPICIKHKFPPTSSYYCSRECQQACWADHSRLHAHLLEVQVLLKDPKLKNQMLEMVNQDIIQHNKGTGFKCIGKLSGGKARLFGELIVSMCNPFPFMKRCPIIDELSPFHYLSLLDDLAWGLLHKNSPLPPDSSEHFAAYCSLIYYLMALISSEQKGANNLHLSQRSIEDDNKKDYRNLKKDRAERKQIQEQFESTSEDVIVNYVEKGRTAPDYHSMSSDMNFFNLIDTRLAANTHVPKKKPKEENHYSRLLYLAYERDRFAPVVDFSDPSADLTPMTIYMCQKELILDNITIRLMSLDTMKRQDRDTENVLRRGLLDQKVQDITREFEAQWTPDKHRKTVESIACCRLKVDNTFLENSVRVSSYITQALSKLCDSSNAVGKDGTKDGANASDSDGTGDDSQEKGVVSVDEAPHELQGLIEKEWQGRWSQSLTAHTLLDVQDYSSRLEAYKRMEPPPYEVPSSWLQPLSYGGHASPVAWREHLEAERRTVACSYGPCGNRGDNFSKCGRCKAVKYCSKSVSHLL